jgi:hypothetical protein
MGLLQRLAPLALLTPGLLAQTTPSDFLVRVHTVEVSQDGLVWLEAFSPAGGHLVDIVGTGVQNLGQGDLPVGIYPSVRVSLSAIMQIETDDPCGGGTIIDLVDWTGHEMVDPDGDGRWDVYFSTPAYGGTNSASGNLTHPLMLDQPIQVEEAKVAPLRMILGITGNVRCEQGQMVMDPPRVQLSLLEDGSTSQISGTTYQITGMHLKHAAGGPEISTFKGEGTLHGDGRWTSDLMQWRDLDLVSGDNQFGAQPWSGWWSALPDGGLWMTRSGVPESITGWVRTGGGAFSVASTGGGDEAFLMWGLRKGPPANEHPFTSPHRIVVHDFDIQATESNPLVADLSTSRLFGRFIGDLGLAHFDYTAQRNRMNIKDWIGGSTGAPMIDIDWLPLSQGLAYSVAPGTSRVSLTLLDLSSYYAGWLGPNSDVGILDRRDLPANRQGLAITMRIGGGMDNASVQGRSYKGAFVADNVLDYELSVLSGKVELHFVTPTSCLWIQTSTGVDGFSRVNTAGTYAVWDEGRVVLNMVDGRTFEGQVDPGRNTLSITSSEDGVQGSEDRLIGLLVRS